MVGLEKPARMMRQNCLHLNNRIVVRQDMHPDRKNVPWLHMRPQAVIVKRVGLHRFVTNQIAYCVKQNIS
jgi:hypothetical protein